MLPANFWQADEAEKKGSQVGDPGVERGSGRGNARSKCDNGGPA